MYFISPHWVSICNSSVSIKTAKTIQQISVSCVAVFIVVHTIRESFVLRWCNDNFNAVNVHELPVCEPTFGLLLISGLWWLASDQLLEREQCWRGPSFLGLWSNCAIDLFVYGLPKTFVPFQSHYSEQDGLKAIFDRHIELLHLVCYTTHSTQCKTHTLVYCVYIYIYIWVTPIIQFYRYTTCWTISSIYLKLYKTLQSLIVIIFTLCQEQLIF